VGPSDATFDPVDANVRSRTTLEQPTGPEPVPALETISRRRLFVDDNNNNNNSAFQPRQPVTISTQVPQPPLPVGGVVVVTPPNDQEALWTSRGNATVVTSTAKRPTTEESPLPIGTTPRTAREATASTAVATTATVHQGPVVDELYETSSRDDDDDEEWEKVCSEEAALPAPPVDQYSSARVLVRLVLLLIWVGYWPPVRSRVRYWKATAWSNLVWEVPNPGSIVVESPFPAISADSPFVSEGTERHSRDSPTKHEAEAGARYDDDRMKSENFVASDTHEPVGENSPISSKTSSEHPQPIDGEQSFNGDRYVDEPVWDISIKEDAAWDTRETSDNNEWDQTKTYGGKTSEKEGKEHPDEDLDGHVDEPASSESTEDPTQWDSREPFLDSEWDQFESHGSVAFEKTDEGHPGGNLNTHVHISVSDESMEGAIERATHYRLHESEWGQYESRVPIAVEKPGADHSDEVFERHVDEPTSDENTKETFAREGPDTLDDSEWAQPETYSSTAVENIDDHSREDVDEPALDDSAEEATEWDARETLSNGELDEHESQGSRAVENTGDIPGAEFDRHVDDFSTDQSVEDSNKQEGHDTLDDNEGGQLETSGSSLSKKAGGNHSGEDLDSGVDEAASDKSAEESTGREGHDAFGNRKLDQLESVGSMTGEKIDGENPDEDLDRHTGESASEDSCEREDHDTLGDSKIDPPESLVSVTSEKAGGDNPGEDLDSHADEATSEESAEETVEWDAHDTLDDSELDPHESHDLMVNGMKREEYNEDSQKMETSDDGAPDGEDRYAAEPVSKLLYEGVQPGLHHIFDLDANDHQKDVNLTPPVLRAVDASDIIFDGGETKGASETVESISKHEPMAAKDKNEKPHGLDEESETEEDTNGESKAFTQKNGLDSKVLDLLEASKVTAASVADRLQSEMAKRGVTALPPAITMKQETGKEIVERLEIRIRRYLHETRHIGT
jgi:hypothetical protein